MPIAYAGREFTFVNPDGSEVRVRGFGNQYSSVFETLDGFTVIEDPNTGYQTYAKLDESGDELVSSGLRVGIADPRSLNLRPHLRGMTRSGSTLRELPGTPRWEERRADYKKQKLEAKQAVGKEIVGPVTGLCILIDFPDVAATTTRQEVHNFFNQVGYTNASGTNGSVQDYFKEVSGGRFTFSNVVTQYVRAPNPKSFYTDPSVPQGTRARQLISEALTVLVNSNFNFAGLTLDGARFVKALSVLYAGPNTNSWSKGLWPHSFYLDPPFAAPGNVKFHDYQISPVDLDLGTVCHECGHMVCDFPDLYDTDNRTDPPNPYQSQGVGFYCLMGSGSNGQNGNNPTLLSAYLKWEAGWTYQVQSLTPGAVVTLTSGRNDFAYYGKSFEEYFICENRQATGRDASLPDSGLAIWHVDEAKNGNNEQEMTEARHYECSLEQADGRFDLESNRLNWGDAGDLLTTNNEFGPDTTPDSRWWNGNTSTLRLRVGAGSGATLQVSVLPIVPPTTPPCTEVFRLLLEDD